MPRKKLLLVVIVILAINIVVFYPRNITNALQDSIDFHSYWYSGHFVLQGSDPYEAYFQGREPQLPIHYIDGKVTSSYPIGQEVPEKVPANTAPIVLFVTLFSLLSWPTARLLWLFLNLSLILAIPWLAIRLWPSTTAKNENLNKLLVFFLFLSFTSTRIFIGVGQTSGLIFTLMLLAILTVNRNWVLSGVALGLALSKYSLSLPIVLFFLFKKQYKVVLLSFLIQIAGVLALSLITNTSPLQILYEYFRMLLGHRDLPGINITSALQIPSLAPSSLLLLLLFTSVVIIPTIFWIYRYYYANTKQEFIDFHVLSILNIWNLLAFYHREYDMIVMILPILLFVYGISDNIWYLSSKERKFLYLLIGFISFWLIRPQKTIISFLSNQFGLDIETLYEIAHRLNMPVLLLCLALLVALLYRIRPPATVQSSTQDAGPIQTVREA